MSKSRVLIEDWLPIKELGIESRRERKIFTDLPPLNYLHVWWARRPIVASQAVVLAGVMPAWSPDLANEFNDLRVSTRDEYIKYFFRLIGLVGDPVRGSEREALGIKGKEAFGYSQAWKNSPSRKDTDLLAEILKFAHGYVPRVADVTAGGGAIPFAAARYGLETDANDLSSVAAAIIMGGVAYPAKYGDLLPQKFEYWSQVLAERVGKQMADFFPVSPVEEVSAYIYAYQLRCPRSNNWIPVLPSLWLDEQSPRTAAKIIVKGANYKIKLVGDSEIDFDPSKGTIKGGQVISPYDNLIVEGSYVKEQAKLGKLEPFLYAVAVRGSSGGSRRAGKLYFRDPSKEELAAIEKAGLHLEANRENFQKLDLIPEEDVEFGAKTTEAQNYGIKKWSQFFTDRQLLTHATFVKEYRGVLSEIKSTEGEMYEAIACLLTLMHGKMIDYNSRMSAWNVRQGTVRNGFESHNFAFKSTFAEKMIPEQLVLWASKQVAKSARVSADLQEQTRFTKAQVRVHQGTAASIPGIESGSIDHVCMDPPYYDNVMYAELSDMFYIWHKRTFGSVKPELFPTSTADVHNEAVANSSRFMSNPKRKKELADLDYEAKMTAIFYESHRILKDSGILTVMFTHKKAEAWDTLGMGLLSAGYVIENSWPINTEFEFSFHQANQNSAASTVMLVCRKQSNDKSEGMRFLEDLESEIRQAARDAVQKFENDGIAGVDLLLSTYGPTLSVISRNWPVYSSTPDSEGKNQLLRPEQALTIARQELVLIRQRQIIGHGSELDEFTNFVLIAWDTFKSTEFSFDTGRLLALATNGLDIDVLVKHKLILKEAGKVRMLEPFERVRREADHAPGGVRVNARTFDYLIDAVHTCLYISKEDGFAAGRKFLEEANLLDSAKFKDTVQALLNTIPRTIVDGKWVFSQAELLDNLAVTLFPDVKIPEKDIITKELEPLTLFDGADLTVLDHDI